MRLLVGLAVVLLTSRQPEPVHITVRVLRVRATAGGLLHVALHREPGEGFPGRSSFANQAVRPLGEDVVVTFEAPPGRYAVAVHHDANANGKMDSNFLGIPKEGYAVSNDARPKFRAPRFSEAEVSVTRDTALVVHMNY